MKIVDIVNIEECIDGVTIKEFRLEDSITEPDIFRLGERGDLEYFSHFPRPFYRITLPSGDQLKGVLAHDRIQALFKRFQPEQLDSVSEMIETETGTI